MGSAISILAIAELLDIVDTSDSNEDITFKRSKERVQHIDKSMYQWLFDKIYSVISGLIVLINHPTNNDNISYKSENEWIIDGKVYDLSTFLDDHPGGKHILLINRGRDCTELFFSYHLASNKNIDFMKGVLKKYYIGNASSDKILSPFKWTGKDLEIYLDFKSRIQSYFKQNANKFNNREKASYPRIIWCFILFILLIYLYKYYFAGYWMTIPILSLIHWLLSSALLHNGTHYQLVRNANINQLVSLIGGFFHSPNIQWELQHVISHHCYTNINGLDIDLNHFLDNFRTSKQQKYEKIYAKWRYFIPIYILATSIGQIDAWTGRRERHIHRTIPFWSKNSNSATYVLSIYFLQTLWIFFILPLSVWYEFGNIGKTLLFILLPRIGHGVLFYIFSQVSHIQNDAFYDNDILQSESWIIHQIKSAVDYSIDSLFWNIMSIGLNNQTIHHLLPSVHPCHFIELEPILNKFCNDYNIKRNVYPNIFITLYSHFKHLGRIND